MDGFAWRRLPPRNASGSLQGTSGQSNATAAATAFGSKGHKLAVLVPYRDRPAQLETMLPALTAHLQVRHGFKSTAAFHCQGMQIHPHSCRTWLDLRLIAICFAFTGDLLASKLLVQHGGHGPDEGQAGLHGDSLLCGPVH